MGLDTDLVRRLCRLARLDLEETELGPMTAELDRILAHMGRLIQVPTEGVPVSGAIPLRPDLPLPALDRTAVLGLAPCADGCYFLVPNAMEGET